MEDKKKKRYKTVNHDEQAFPTEYVTGLTKREYIATQLMIAQRIAFSVGPAKDLAQCALEDADALIEALNEHS